MAAAALSLPALSDQAVAASTRLVSAQRMSGIFGPANASYPPEWATAAIGLLEQPTIWKEQPRHPSVFNRYYRNVANRLVSNRLLLGALGGCKRDLAGGGPAARLGTSHS